MGDDDVEDGHQDSGTETSGSEDFDLEMKVRPHSVILPNALI